MCIRGCVCYQASGEAIRGLRGLFRLSAACHSLRALCETEKHSFMTLMAFTATYAFIDVVEGILMLHKPLFASHWQFIDRIYFF